MKEAKRKILTSSKWVFVVLLLLAAFILLGTALDCYSLVTGGRGTIAEVQRYHRAVEILHKGLITVYVLYTAFIFREIGKQETPFTEVVPRRMKISAVLFFAVNAIPQWMHYLVSNRFENSSSFAVVDNFTGLVLIISCVIYCLGKVFDYGCVIQDENFEIL